MKKKNLVLSILLLTTIFLLNSCASLQKDDPTSSTQGFAKTIEEAHPDRIEKTIIGMNINDFKTVWPEAHRSGVSENGETYEFIYTHLYTTTGVSSLYYKYLTDYKIYTNFYFTNGKLTKYESIQKSGL